MEDNANAAFILDCMEASIDEETKLMKELELLTACAFSEPNDELLMPTIMNEHDVNLAIPDPKSQNEIDRMSPKDKLRFNNATISEVNGMKNKKFLRTPRWTTFLKELQFTKAWLTGHLRRT